MRGLMLLNALNDCTLIPELMCARPSLRQPDRSRVGMDGVNPTTDASYEQLKQVSRLLFFPTAGCYAGA